MKRILYLIILASIFVSNLQAQRIKIGSQLEKSLTGEAYMVTTDAITGKQQYVTVASVIIDGGGADVVQSLTYDGDTLLLTTNLSTFNSIINSGSINISTAITIDGTVYPIGTKLQVIFENLALDGEKTTVSDGVIIDLTLTGDDISGDIFDGSIPPVKLDRAYLETEVDGDPANELQTIVKAGSLVTLSDGGGSFTDDVDDADADPNNEIELPVGGNNLDVLQTDGAGTYTWVAQTGGGESTTVSDGTTVDLTLTGVDITAEVILDPIGTNTITAVSGLLVEDELPTGGNNLDVLQTNGAGIYTWVAQTGGGESTTVSDGNTIDLTLTGVDITAEVTKDISAENILTSSASGLLADAPVDGVNNQVNGLDIVLNGSEQVELNYNILELSEGAFAEANIDWMLFYDVSFGDYLKIKIENIQDGFEANTDTQDLGIVAGSSDLTLVDGGSVALQTRLTSYDDDAAAGTGGVVAGQEYKLTVGNPYGMPVGTIRVKQ